MGRKLDSLKQPVLNLQHDQPPEPLTMNEFNPMTRNERLALGIVAIIAAADAACLAILVALLCGYLPF
jgi:hypothetical protein